MIIPADFPVRPLKPSDTAKDRVTCNTCKRSWDDAIPTTWTPAPSARCPFEYFHEDEFVRAYIECALWSSNDESDDQGGEPLDKNYTIDDLALETLVSMRTDCESFQASNADDIANGSTKCSHVYSDSERAGHDFWLTRNGHGAGFWDGDWPEPQATRLTDASKAFGNVDLYVGDDGKIYQS